MADAPVGRSREWRELTPFVEQRQTSVILVGGAAGSGRTHVVNALAELAASQGFFVPTPDAALPPLERTSTLPDIHRALSAVFEIPPAAVPSSPELVPTGDSPPLQVEPQGAPPQLGPRARSGGSVDSPLWRLAEWALRGAGRAVNQYFFQHRAIVSLFRERAPVLLAVDGYDPSELVHSWIVNGLLPSLRGVKEPVILIFLDRLPRLERLRKDADITCELGPLDTTEVARHLSAAGASLSPRLGDAELRAYAEEAAQTPGLLKAFEDVFEVAGRARSR